MKNWESDVALRSSWYIQMPRKSDRRSPGPRPREGLVDFGKGRRRKDLDKHWVQLICEDGWQERVRTGELTGEARGGKKKEKKKKGKKRKKRREKKRKKKGKRDYRGRKEEEWREEEVRVEREKVLSPGRYFSLRNDLATFAYFSPSTNGERTPHSGFKWYEIDASSP